MEMHAGDWVFIFLQVKYLTEDLHPEYIFKALKAQEKTKQLNKNGQKIWTLTQKRYTVCT